jgi:exodeoxyribonuclease VII small subunit
MNQKPFEFEQALKELEQITAWFESSDVDLDQGLVKFERGMELASLLKDHLLTVENRVEKIRQRFSGQKTGPASQDTEELPQDAGSDQPDLFEM